MYWITKSKSYKKTWGDWRIKPLFAIWPRKARNGRTYWLESIYAIQYADSYCRDMEQYIFFWRTIGYVNELPENPHLLMNYDAWRSFDGI